MNHEHALEPLDDADAALGVTLQALVELFDQCDDVVGRQRAHRLVDQLLLLVLQDMLEEARKAHK